MYVTSTSIDLGASTVIVNVTSDPSLADESFTDMPNVSSLVIVPVPVPPVVMSAESTPAPAGVTAPSTTVNVSSASTTPSAATTTVIFCVSPAVPVKVNEASLSV